jgi:hypothetical protein
LPGAAIKISYSLVGADSGKGENKMSEDQGFVISGAENIAKFQLLRVYHALKLQAKTGMKCKGGSLLKYAKHHYGAKGRTAKEVADSMQAKFGL